MPIATAPVVCLLMGLVALLQPERFAAQVGLAADGPLGRSELRAVFGGVFVGIGVACLVLATPGAYVVGGAAFLGGAGAKLVSAALERGVFPAALLGLVVDLVLGALFLWGAGGLG